MKDFMSQFISLAMCLMLLVACGGRTAAPVMVSQYGDGKRSCEALEFELSTVQGEIQRLLPKTDKSGKNVALGVAGWFLIVPLFFMDFKNAEQVEYEAYRQRYNHLSMIATDKGCGVEVEKFPSVQEMKDEIKRQEAAKEAVPKSSSNINKK